MSREWLWEMWEKISKQKSKMESVLYIQGI